MAKAPKRPAGVPADAIWDVDEWLHCARDEHGRFQGAYRNWFADGKLKYEGTVKDSKQVGEHKTYHPDGTVFRITTWRDGRVLDDTYVRSHAETEHDFPEDVEQIWKVEYLSRDGRSDHTRRYFDDAGHELDVHGTRAPARPTAVPAEARWLSRFTVDDETAGALHPWYGKLDFGDEGGWVEGAIDRESDMRLGRWRWWRADGTLLREEQHDDHGVLESAREGDTLESNEERLAALAADRRRGYEALLGKPLAAFDAKATYAFFFCIEDNESAPAAVGLGRWDELAWSDLRAPASPRAAKACDTPSQELDWNRFAMDRGRSLFFVSGKKLGTAKKGPVALTGAELAAAADKAGLGPSELLGDFVYVRAQTDGTLADAMAAATWTMSAPLGLVEEDGEIDEQWAEKLAVVKDAKLAAHLRMLCVDDNTARSSGGFFLGSDTDAGMWDWVMDELPGEVLAAWQFGEGYASAAVVKLR